MAPLLSLSATIKYVNSMIMTGVRHLFFITKNILPKLIGSIYIKFDISNSIFLVFFFF
jgi:hypothetical protein